MTNTKERTIIDKKTGLEWSPTLGDRVNWKKAKEVAAACRAGGHDDWRLPTIAELETLRDLSRFDPAADPALGLGPNYYWSSTPLASSPGDCAWLVNFDLGNVLDSLQDSTACVRAVRGSRAGQ